MNEQTPKTMRRRSPEQRRQKHKKDRPQPESLDAPWRLFVAVRMSEAVREQMAQAIESLSDKNLPVRWVDAANGHLTLHFIGETQPEIAELLRMALGAAISHHPPFELRTTAPGAFPALKRPRVLWLGLWGPTYRLEELYNDIGDFLDDFGLEIEEADFHPHLTLGRVRPTQDVRVGELPERIREVFTDLSEHGIAGEKINVPYPVDEVQLIRSHLGADGPRYEVLASYPLSGSDAP